MSAPARVMEMAREAGFDLVGLARIGPPRGARRFLDWLAAGRHAGMAWLERDRERIVDPGRLLPGGRSLLALGLAHHRPPVQLAGGGRVARFAAGRDYHNVAGRALRKLARRLVREGLVGDWRKVVDAGPLMERSHAAEAGLGFESKAANLLHADHGPWFFLAELLLDRELEPTADAAPGSCGTCRACLDACPTGAILEAGVVDANRCISYHTIESRAPVPRELRPAFGEWVFGCDVCSEVCPWGQRSGDRSAAFGTHPEIERGSLVDWLRIPEAEFAGRFAGSALQRPGREGLARSAATALGNAPSERGRGALLEALEGDPSPVVREAAGWALGRAHSADSGVRGALDAAARREADPRTRSGLRGALDT